MGENAVALLGIDVGATGIKAGLFDLTGTLLRSASRRNGPLEQSGGQPGWMIWDVERIWRNVCEACTEILSSGTYEVRGVSVTGFGADGVPLTREGKILYPMISWHCSRTVPQSQWFNEQISPLEIYNITGYHNYPINTVNRLRWLRENEPQVLDDTYQWLMVQDYVVYRLTGAFSTEPTIASTTMAFDLQERHWSSRILNVAEVPRSILPEPSAPGTVLGLVSQAAAAETSIPLGTPVATGGHDCEIGALGSGVGSSDIFIDITGTWEMVIASLNHFDPSPELFSEGIDFECHTIPGMYLCQGLMLAGGVVEWVLDAFYRDVPQEQRYAALMKETQENGIGAGGVVVLPAFVRGMGAFQRHGATGLIAGLTTTSSRGQIGRAALEACCYQLRKQLAVISHNTGATPQALRVLGGATRNPFWLQMKADVTGLPVQVPQHPEVTLLGAAMLAGIGSGQFKSIDEAISATHFDIETYNPNAQAHERYTELFEKVFMPLPASMESINRTLEQAL